MENIKELGYVNSSLILYSTNYEYWKARKVAFLKSMVNKNCNVDINWWTPHMIKANDFSESMQHEKDWEPAEDKSALEIIVPLILFIKEFTRTFSWSLTFAPMLNRHGKLLKWHMKKILKFECQGFNSSLRILKTWRCLSGKLLLSSIFVTMTFANSSFSLSENILEEKLMRKIMSSLPKRFNIKFGELFDSFLTFETTYKVNTTDVTKENITGSNFILANNFSKDIRRLD